MLKTTIYHNPRCSKSRQTLAILESHDLDINVVKYLTDPPNEATIKQLLSELNISIREVLRSGEKEYKNFGFDDESLDEDALITLLTQHPKVLQRPIVSHNGRAVIGRPPENVLEII